MICPVCQTDNPPGSKFCNECGQKLIAKCPQCGQENPPGAKFCNECGARLTSAPEPRGVADPHLPPASPSVPGIHPLHSDHPSPITDHPSPITDHPSPITDHPSPLTDHRSPLTDHRAPITDHPSPISNLQTLIPTDFAAKLETARTQKTMVGERRIVTMLFCDVKGSTAAAGQLDPEDWAQIMNGVFEYMIRPVYKYEGTVARLMGDAILAFFGAPVAHEDDPQRAVLAGMEMVEGFVPYREQIQRDWSLEINVRVGINTGLVMVGAVGSDLQMEYTALGDAINLAARMEQTATPGTVQVAEDTYKLAAPMFTWEDLGTVDIKGKDEPVHTYRPLHPKAQPGRLRGIEGLDAPMVGRDAELETLHRAIHQLEQGLGSIIFITGEAGLGKSRLIRELYNTQSPITDHQSPITDHPSPITHHRSPITHHRSPITHHRSPITHHPSPITDHRSPITDHPSLITFHESASFSYETTQPYALFQRLVRRVCGVQETDSPAEMWEKFLPILNLIPADVPDQGRVFEALFAFHGQSTARVPEGETFKRQLFDLMARLWQHWAEEAPRVFILDDLHWADPASVDLLRHLFKLTETHPIVIVCATRPDRETPGWTAKEWAAKEYPHRFHEIHIRPLTAEDTNALVDRLLTISDLPAKLRNRILEKTDGNPFFIEEVVRTLMDNGMVVRETHGNGTYWRAVKHIEDIEIPGHLQALLIARIDRLEDSARRTLQLASVIGRSFYFRVLDSINRAIAMVQDGLDRQLLVLQRAELIHEATRVPELEYMFKHALTQEAAYSTILLRQRREFHRQVGEAIEKLFPERLEEFATLLAQHYGEAHDPRAVRYEILAGDAAFRLFAIPEALGHYTRAAQHFQQQKEMKGTPAQIQHLFLRLGRCYELQNEFNRVLEVYQRLMDLSHERQDPRLELAALQAMGVFLAIPTPVRDPGQAQSIADRALGLARELGDRKAEAKIEWMFMLVRMYSGRMSEAIPFGERCAALAREYQLQEELTFALQDLSLAYMGVGELEKAHHTLIEAYDLWYASGNLPMMAENRANLVFERTLRGDFEEAISLSEESIRLSEKAANLWGQGNGRVFVGLVPLAQGNVDWAIKTIDLGISIMQEAGHPGGILAWVQKAWLYDSLGEFETAHAVAEQAMTISTSFIPFYPIALGILAKVKVHLGRLEEAEQILDEAKKYPLRTLLIIDVVVQLASIELLLEKAAWAEAAVVLHALEQLLAHSGAVYFAPDLGRLKARLVQAEGRRDEAVRLLQDASRTAERIGAMNFLWPLQVLLGRLERERGHLEEAQRQMDAARRNVQQIAESMSDVELKARYLAWVDGF